MREYNESDISRLNETVAIPDVVGMTYADAMKELSGKSLNTEAGDLAMGGTTLVKYQWPAAGTLLHKKGLVILYPVDDPEEVMMIIPDFTGRTINECQTMAAESGLNIRISGNTLGVAVSQDPPPTYNESGLPNQPTQPTGPGEPTEPGETTESGQTTETGETDPATVETDPETGETIATQATEPGESPETGAGSETTGTSGTGETTATGGPEQPIIKLIRGSIITITFEAVEEEIAEAGESEETTESQEG